MTKAVVLSSGGLDSTTLLYHAKSRYDEILALSFDYGQRHSVELMRAQLIAARLKIDHRIAELPTWLFLGSALTSGHEVPEGRYDDPTMALTIVPNRNAVMLSMAYAFAESHQADAVCYAAHAGDHPVYPDCRPEFMNAFENMQQWALGHYIQLWAPFCNMTKDQIVKLGHQLEVPFELTWSCYKGGASHCGRCGTCTERKEAFQLAQVADPTGYEDSAFEFPAYRG